MDRKVASNLILGIVVAIAFIGFVFVVFNIGGGTGLFSSQYIVYGRFSHVKGLHYGSEVSLAGLRIGVVKNISIPEDKDKELVVHLAINKEYQDRVRLDSVASIKTQGVLGDKYIEISIGSPNSPRLKNGDWIQTSEPIDIFTKGGNLMEELAKQFQSGDLKLLLANLNRSFVHLSNVTGELERQRIIEKFSKSLVHLEAILAKVDNGEGTLGALINDPSVYEDMKTLLGGAKRSKVLNYFMRQFMESGEPPPKK